MTLDSGLGPHRRLASFGYGTHLVWRPTGRCGPRLTNFGYGTDPIWRPTGGCAPSLFELPAYAVPRVSVYGFGEVAPKRSAGGRRGLAEALAEAGARAEGSHQGLRSYLHDLRFSRASLLDSRPI